MTGMGPNGQEILDQLAMTAPVRSEAVLTLRKLLEMAERGEIMAVSVVYSAGPQKVQVETNTSFPLELHLGAMMLERTLFAMMTSAPKQSPLLMPRR